MSRRGWILSFLLLLVAGGAFLALAANADRTAAPPSEAAITPAAETTAAVGAEGDPGVSPHQVVATYFHTSYRCASCRKLEAYSQEAIGKGFPAELADGRLVWRVVNIDDKGNRHFVDDYKLFTKSVILSDLHGGKETRWKNLPKVWELLGDQEAFLRYVREETKTYLVEDL